MLVSCDLSMPDSPEEKKKKKKKKKKEEEKKHSTETMAVLFLFCFTKHNINA